MHRWNSAESSLNFLWNSAEGPKFSFHSQIALTMISTKLLLPQLFSLTTKEFNFLVNCCVHRWISSKSPLKLRWNSAKVPKFLFHSLIAPTVISTNLLFPLLISLELSVSPNNTTTTSISNFPNFLFTTTEFYILVNCYVHRWISAESQLKSKNFHSSFKLLSLWFLPTYFLHH